MEFDTRTTAGVELTALEQLALVSAVTWLALVTFVLVLVIRQIALLTHRLENSGGTFSLTDDGLSVGQLVPADVLDPLPVLRKGTSYLVVISASCMPCRDLAEDLQHKEIDARLIFLLAGREELADEMASLLPPEVEVVRDPEASRYSEYMNVQSTPFALELEDGIVARKTYLHNASDLLELVETRTGRAIDVIDPPRKEALSDAIAR